MERLSGKELESLTHVEKAEQIDFEAYYKATVVKTVWVLVKG